MILWVLLAFLVQPYSAEEVITILAQPEGNATFPRASFGAVDKLYVNWYFIGSEKRNVITRNPQSGTPKKEHPYSGLSQNFDLIISRVQDSDFGLYQCEQQEFVNVKETKYRLYPVRIPTKKVIVAGNELKLDFDLNKVGLGSLKTTVSCWMPNGNACTFTSQKNQYKLNVPNISVSHHGTWVFTLTYNQQNTILTTVVSVIDLASSEDTVYTSLSYSTFILPCSLHFNLPWLSLNDSGFSESSWTFMPLNGLSENTLLTMKASASPSWTKSSNSSFSGKHLNTPKFSVQSSRVSVNDRGRYTCNLKFNSKTLHKVVMLEVLQILSTANGTVHEGASVNLTCTLGYPLKPDQKVTWMTPTKTSIFLPPLTILSIPSVSVQDSGNWRCILKSNTSTTIATTKLEVVKAPVNIWLVVAGVSGVLIFILLIVIAIVIIRRYKQVIKYKRRKRRFCCCKNPQPKGFYRT